MYIYVYIVTMSYSNTVQLQSDPIYQDILCAVFAKAFIILYLIVIY